MSFTTTERFIPIFEDELTSCRRIDDDLIIFDRDGNVLGTRSMGNHLDHLKSFYDIISPSDAARIRADCVSFDAGLIICDTSLGCAAVFAELFGTVGFLFAIIFRHDRYKVRAFFERSAYTRALLLPSFERLPCKDADDYVTDSIASAIEAADHALSPRHVTVAAYRLGDDVGKFLSSRIFAAAAFAGCIGACRVGLSALPSLEKFSSELFSAVTVCMAVFARRYDPNRRIFAEISDYKGHVSVSVSVGVPSGFDPDKSKLADALLPFICRNAVEKRKYFCALCDSDTDGRRLKISFIPESDPIAAMELKQEFEELIRAFPKSEE